jgi:predicted kinase
LDAAQQVGVGVQTLHCTAPEAVLRQRVSDRQGDIADATVAVLEQQWMEPFAPTEADWVTEIDTTQDLPSQIAAIVGS